MLKSNTTAKNIYASLPASMKSIAASAYSAWIAQKKYGRAFQRFQNEILIHDLYDEQTLRKWQSHKLASFLAETVQRSTYYSKRYSKFVTDAYTNDINKLLKEMPVLKKQEVRQNWNSIALTSKGADTVTLTSSGTTGASLDVVLSSDAYQREYAFRWRYLNEGGAHRRDKFAYFLGNSIFPVRKHEAPYHIMDYYERGIHFSIFHISEKTVEHYITAYCKYSPSYVKGYPSALYEFSRMVKKIGRHLPNVRAVFCASEMLHDFQKVLIEEVFGARIYQWYGQVETTINLHECREGNLHVKETYGYLEILDEHDSDVEPGGTGRAIGTGWGNSAFPLIRYDTGDRMMLAKEQLCKCGGNGRIIEKILGRDEDVIVTPDGRRLGRLDFLFKPVKNVEESQIVQEEIDQLRIRIVPSAAYSPADEVTIRKMVNEYIGDGMHLVIEKCTAIEREKSGKLRYVVSKIPLNPPFQC